MNHTQIRDWYLILFARVWEFMVAPSRLLPWPDPLLSNQENDDALLCFWVAYFLSFFSSFIVRKYRSDGKRGRDAGAVVMNRWATLFAGNWPWLGKNFLTFSLWLLTSGQPLRMLVPKQAFWPSSLLLHILMRSCSGSPVNRMSSPCMSPSCTNRRFSLSLGNTIFTSC